MMWLFAVLILWPLVEISLFVTLGGWLGLWLSLAIVIGTAVLGGLTIRSQGALGAAAIRSALQQGRDPTKPAARGALNILGGVLLMLPGFLTDAAGLLLLLPPVQAGLIRLLAARHLGRGRRQAAPTIEVLEGEWSRVEPTKLEVPGMTRPPSGWTRH